jgi:Photosynthetic reaction centre cytochrome C subunit
VYRVLTGRRATALALGLLAIGASASASSEDPVSDDASAAAVLPHSKPVNIKVLPKDISATDIGKVMKRFESDLGVKCNHCHVENSNTRKFDFASDENPAKNTARMMITMMRDINEKYLPQSGGDSRYANHVTCGTCHQGQSSPPAFDQ